MAGLRTLLRRRGGATFTEVLVSMNIIVVAVLGYSLSSIGVMRQQTVSDHSTVAIHLAQDKIETLQSLDVLQDIDLCPNSGDHGVSAKNGVPGIFDRCWRIGPSPLDAALKQIDVTVSWRDHEERQVSLSTLIYTGEK